MLEEPILGPLLLLMHQVASLGICVFYYALDRVRFLGWIRFDITPSIDDIEPVGICNLIFHCFFLLDQQFNLQYFLSFGND